MLRPDDRTVLLDSLRPPAGYSLDAAVATTFTLTLDAAVLPPLAFSSFAMASSAPDPVALLQAVRNAADRVDIFCQAGAVAIPAQPSDLFAFLEQMIHQVRRPRKGLFHPKVWAVRFVAPDSDPCYRVLVLTRNLTHDRTWDLAVRLDSAAVDGANNPANDGLVDLLASLPAMAPTLPRRRADRVRSLARDLRGVTWQPLDGVSSITFHHLVDGGSLPSFMGGQRLVVSPFVDGLGLEMLRSEHRGTTLVSRAETLDALDPGSLAGVETYVLSSGLTSDEPDDDAPTMLGRLLGLHAKLVVDENWDGRSAAVSIYVGSANATSAAWGGGNVELMLQLDGRRRDLGVDALLDPRTGFGALLEPYPATGGGEPDPQEDELKRLENRLRTIAEIPHTVAVTADDAGTHTLEVTAERRYPLDPGWTCALYPLTLARQGRQRRPIEDAVFERVATTEVTPFVCVELTSETGLTAGTVVLANLVGDPPDRLDLTIAQQLDSPEKFLRFLLLVLSLGNPHLLAQLTRAGAAGGGAVVDLGTGPGILELVLRALAERPESLDDLASVVERMRGRVSADGQAILPQGFDELWSAVEDARRRLVTSNGGAR